LMILYGGVAERSKAPA